MWPGERRDKSKDVDREKIEQEDDEMRRIASAKRQDDQNIARIIKIIMFLAYP
jgi:hypothetical protein